MSDLPQEVARLLSVVSAQQQSIDRLTRLLEVWPRPAEPSGPPEPAAAQTFVVEPAVASTHRLPIDWDVISGPQRAAAWRGLAAFVEKTVLRYGLHFDILPCWWQHRSATAVLTSLWEVYLHTYGEDANLLSNNTFLDQLNYRVDQLRSIFSSCREDHTDFTPRSWMPEHTRQAFATMVSRDTGTAPINGRQSN